MESVMEASITCNPVLFEPDPWFIESIAGQGWGRRGNRGMIPPLATPVRGLGYVRRHRQEDLWRRVFYQHNQQLRTASSNGISAN